MAAPGRSRRFARIIGTSGSPRGDIALAAAVSAFAGLLWWQSLAIPPPFFDPLGSAAVPRAIALILAVLSILVLARALLALPWPATVREQGFRPRPDIALGLVLLVVAYIALMQAEVLSFRTATIVFLIAATALLGRLGRMTMIVGVVTAVVIGVGGTMLFTQFFYIDLPR